MSEPEMFFNGIRVESVEELDRLLNESMDRVDEAEKAVQEKYGVSHTTACAIVYLRSRSRWTPEKERELVARDKDGDPIPLSTVLSGEF